MIGWMGKVVRTLLACICNICYLSICIPFFSPPLSRSLTLYSHVKVCFFFFFILIMLLHAILIYGRAIPWTNHFETRLLWCICVTEWDTFTHVCTITSDRATIQRKSNDFALIFIYSTHLLNGCLLFAAKTIGIVSFRWERNVHTAHSTQRTHHSIAVDGTRYLNDFF